VLLTARHEQGRIILTVEDDGRGIDTARVKTKAIERGAISEKEAAGLSVEEIVDLIFLPGLSTAQVVSSVSGRGVGMDIVRNNIEHLNGNVLVETWPGRGTRFQIVLPLTLAIMPTLLVKVGQNTFAIPLVAISETLRISPEEMQTVQGRSVILLRDSVLPIIRLADAFNLHSNGSSKNYEYVVVIRSGKSMLGLMVDALLGEQEVVVKSLSSVIGEVPGIASAAILGDGQVALILDVQGLLKLASRR
jgi:two-component system chemotaxis sensor kinase CheA